MQASMKDMSACPGIGPTKVGNAFLIYCKGDTPSFSQMVGVSYIGFTSRLDLKHIQQSLLMGCPTLSWCLQSKAHSLSNFLKDYIGWQPRN